MKSGGLLDSSSSFVLSTMMRASESGRGVTANAGSGARCGKRLPEYLPLRCACGCRGEAKYAGMSDGISRVAGCERSVGAWIRGEDMQ